MAKKLTQKEAEDYIKSKGGILLSTYISSRNKVKIKCLKCKYEWEVRWNDITSGRWCPKCSGNILPLLDEVEKIIKEKGGILLTPETYKSAKSSFVVRCLKDNYEWKTCWDRIKRGSWCPKCSKRLTITYEEIEAIIKSKGGILLEAPKKILNISRVKIKCIKGGHVWSPVCSTIKNSNKWCPFCKKSFNQNRLLGLIKEIIKVNVIENYHGFDWLKHDRKLEIDIWIPELKIAIEYDGEQHFKPVRFGGVDIKEAKINLKYVQNLDSIKNKLISEHPNEIKHFIRFNYKEELTKEFVINKLIKHGIQI